MYGLFIVLIYTVPICLIIGLTWAFGGATVTADIFNWLSTHWLPNILFFIIFMVFAASFFGAFEITLPSKWTNTADSGADKGGMLGVFFLALTLVLVSFSCTGPIVGTVLIKSTQGEFWTPMVTMLAFSIAFALPFTLLAFFPSVLKKLPKSGGWLNSVKVVLGFIEIALGLKFLSVADQTYHWHLLDREVYLAIWIVCFTLLGFYLLGKIRFKYDSPLEYISVGRLVLVIIDFAFVVWMIPGMWGAPLKALSGYLPPIQTQDFVLGRYEAPAPPAATATFDAGSTVALPHGLTGYDNLDDAIAAAAAQGKKVFVDISGHGCVNCREMEARVWSDPEVLRRLQNDFVIATLYVDDKTPLPKEKWVINDSGKTLKDVGRVNSDMILKRFGVNSQPNYFILDGEGNTLAGPRGYNLDTDAFVKFLDL
jgi:thiol:disulfide interchange protein DsbD